jgi:hypothetical protein
MVHQSSLLLSRQLCSIRLRVQDLFVPQYTSAIIIINMVSCQLSIDIKQYKKHTMHHLSSLFFNPFSEITHIHALPPLLFLTCHDSTSVTLQIRSYSGMGSSPYRFTFDILTYYNYKWQN